MHVRARVLSIRCRHADLHMKEQKSRAGQTGRTTGYPSWGCVIHGWA
jgi:hypothetical protein